MVNLNKNIIQNIEGPNIIIAGPGTGKTTTLVGKIEYLLKHLIKKKKFKDGIIVCTFTNKATEELKKRIYSKIDFEDLAKFKIEIGTIHNICLNILQNYCGDKYIDHEVLNENLQLLYIYNKLPNFLYSKETIKLNGWKIAKELADVFSRITDLNLNKENLKLIKNPQLKKECEKYDIYLKLLKNEKYFDFATIQKTLLDECTKNKEIKKELRKDFKYFFVDEYQDTNDLQHKIFQFLTGPDFNLSVVGDNNQSIYGFRGSNVENLLDLDKWLKKKKIKFNKFFLTTNYRSTKNIINATNTIFKDKKILPSRSDVGPKPIIIEFQNDEEESDYIVKTIKFLSEKKKIFNLNEIAILVRSIRYTTELLKKLNNYDISFNVIGSGRLFSNSLGREFLALLSFYLDEDDEKEENFLDNLEDIKDKYYLDLQNFYTEKKIKELENFVKKNKNLKSQINLTYELMKFANFFQRYEKNGEDLGKITEIALQFDDARYYNPFNFYSYLNFLRNNKLADEGQSENENFVSIMTIHQAKGLEFPVVFLPSQIERAKPPMRMTDKLSEETKKNEYLKNEEKRVFYVACSRAKDLLFLTHTKNLISTRKDYGPNFYLTDLYNSGTVTKKLDIKKRLSRINKEEEEMMLSFNKINSYIICPLQYKYRHQWMLQSARFGGMLYGSNVHRVIEMILKKIMDGKIVNQKKIEDLTNFYWNDSIIRNPSENLKFKKTAIKQIQNTYDLNKEIFNKKNIFSIEEKFLFPIKKNFLVNGRYDLVTKNSESYEIIDFKTGVEKDYSLQLNFYKFCFQTKYKVKNTKLSVIGIKDGQKNKIEEMKTSKVEEKVFDIAYNIKQKKFEPNPGPQCSDCAFNKICIHAI